MPRLCSSLLLSLVIASSASGLTMTWSFVGDPGNAADTEVMSCCGISNGTTGYGDVSYEYYIGTYEVTNAQYAEFLNAIAKTDTFGLWDSFFQYITRSGSSGSYSYAPAPGRDNHPVLFVSFWEAIRFANWMSNGQPAGFQNSTTTEGGSYTITTAGLANGTIVRNPGAQIVVPNEDEWYKAAYYDPISKSYFDYATGSNAITCSHLPNPAPNYGNCRVVNSTDYGFVIDVGSFPGSLSPNGTFDQSGNAREWNETIISLEDHGMRGVRGGMYGSTTNDDLRAGFRISNEPPSYSSIETGFRLAYIPEPSTGLLVIAGLIGVAGWRRARG